MPSFHQLSAISITGQDVPMSDYEGTVALVVNVASRCGLTGQYAGLRTLHETFSDQGFTVLAFPCNQFGAQEPGTDAEIEGFACSRYGVGFPMFSKIEVNGPDAHPIYRYLKTNSPDQAGEELPWNFTKFLVGRDGSVLARLDPGVTPDQIATMLPGLL